MLKTTIRKNLTVLGICLGTGLFASCGQKIQKQGEEGKETRTPALSTNTLDLSNDGTSLQEYVMPEVGRVFLPEKIDFIGGNTDSPTKIIFNGGTTYEAHCFYGPKMSPEHSLINCYDGDSVLSDPDYFIHVDGDKITLENPEAKVRARVEIEWH